MSRLLNNYKLDTTLWRDCSLHAQVHYKVVNRLSLCAQLCKYIVIYLQGVSNMHCQDWQSSQQHPNQPLVLHHQCSLPFHLVNRRKNHAGDDGTLPTYVIGGLARQSNRTPRCSREVSAAG